MRKRILNTNNRTLLGRLRTCKMVMTSFLFTVLFFISSGCKKLVEVKSPDDALTSNNIYDNDATASAVLTGVYTTLANFSPLRAQTINSISLVAATSADEFSVFGGASNGNTVLVQFYQNKLSPGLATAAGFTIWNDFFSRIYIVNLALERLNSSTALTPLVKQQLIGEAKFLRAFLYFYLVNLYGDVPLTTSSDYRINAILSRSSKDLVYKQIINDLKDAQNLLSDYYVAADAKTTTTERVRPNKWAAGSLLSRVYLYDNNWSEAEAQATAVINNTGMYDTVPLNSTFLKNSKEAIWQLQPVNTGWNTEDARVFILPPTGPTSNASGNYPVYLTNQLLNAFETGDKRKVNWVSSVTVGGATYYYPYKYKSATLNAPVTEYTMVLRLGEQYLIRAEARAHLGKIQEGLNDLNVIRNRAGLADTTAPDHTTLLNLIYHERQVELFTEWGHRWLDLKRTGMVDQVMSAYAPQKGASWSPNWALYPIPLYDITQDPNLKQNPGY